jgi:hypothetical protein
MDPTHQQPYEKLLIIQEQLTQFMIVRKEIQDIFQIVAQRSSKQTQIRPFINRLKVLISQLRELQSESGLPLGQFSEKFPIAG